MFHDLTPAMTVRMRELEAIDTADRTDGTPHAQRLRQIPPDTGKLLAILAASAPPGRLIEVGTGAGYSALWITRGARRLTSFELSPEKAALARQTLAMTGADTLVDLVEGDAVSLLPALDNIAFCFQDAERAIIAACFEIVLPRLVPGGLFCVDNVISHGHQIPEFLDAIPRDTRVDSVIVPIGSGVLVCRKPG